MFGIKKKESADSRGLPDLPSSFKLSSKPELIAPRKILPAQEEREDLEELEELNERHPLPAFPDEKISNGFANSAIKDAVKDTPQEIDTNELEDLGKEIDLSTSEEKGRIRALPDIEPNEIPAPRFELPRDSMPKGYKPLKQPEGSEVFVKIDKYRTARRSLQYAQDMLEEIDDLLKKIKETRMREEQELLAWEKQVKEAKAQVENVREGIFEKAK